MELILIIQWITSYIINFLKNFRGGVSFPKDPGHLFDDSGHKFEHFKEGWIFIVRVLDESVFLTKEGTKILLVGDGCKIVEKASGECSDEEGGEILGCNWSTFA
jgi:hypothetical protein